MKHRLRSLLPLALLALVVAGVAYFGSRGPDAPLRPRAGPEPSEGSRAATAGPATELRASPAERVVRHDVPVSVSAGDLVGRVVTAGGEPVAGASVLVAAAPAFPAALDSLAFEEPELRALRRQTVTADDGRFSFPQASPGTLLVGIRKDGFAPRDEAHVLRRGLTLDLGDLVVEPGTVLQGRVVDPTGNPVAGARLIQIVREPALLEDRLERLGREVIAAHTDERGDFRIERQAVGAWKIRVTSPSHPSKVFAGHSPRAGDDSGHVFRLERGEEIRGRFLGERLGSVDVRAVVLREHGRDVSLPYEHRIMRASCEQDGSFRLGWFPPDAGAHLFRVTAYAGGQAVSETELARPGDGNVVLAGLPVAVVEFTLLGANEGAPIVDPEIALAYWNDGVSINARPLSSESVDVDRGTGRFRLTVAVDPSASPRATLGLCIARDGYCTFIAEDLGLVAGGRVELGTIQLRPRPVLAVRVVGPDGEGVGGAVVRTAPAPRAEADAPAAREPAQTYQRAEAWGTGVTDGDGRCRVPLPDDRSSFVTATSEGFAPAPPRLVAGTSTAEECVLRLDRGATITVRVTDPDRTPQPAAIVWERAAPDDVLGHVLSRSSAGIEQYVADSRGTVVLENQPVGSHEFAARRSDSEVPDEWSRVEVPEGIEELEVSLVLPSLVQLTGRLRSNGAALPDATITLGRGAQGAELFTLIGSAPPAPAGVTAGSDGAGFFSFDGVEAGAYELEARHPSLELPLRRSVVVRDDPTHVEIDVELSELFGSVTDAGGEAVAGVAVYAIPRSELDERLAFLLSARVPGPAGERLEPAYTDESGAFRMDGLLSGVELAVVALSDWAVPSISDTIMLRSDRPTAVSLTLAPAGRIRATLLTSSGRPPRFSNVCAIQASRQGAFSSRSHILATPPHPSPVVMELDHLDPGRWSITLLDCVGAPLPEVQLVDVKEGEIEIVLFDLSNR